MALYCDSQNGLSSWPTISIGRQLSVGLPFRPAQQQLVYRIVDLEVDGIDLSARPCSSRS